MENIILDLNNYNAEGSVFKRTAVRGIVERDGKYLSCIANMGITNFQEAEGKTEKRKGQFEDVLEMDSYYFWCNVEADAGNRDLDDYEKEYDYQVAWLPLKEIIKRNQSVDEFEKIPWIIRENMVMKSIIDRG